MSEEAIVYNYNEKSKENLPTVENLLSLSNNELIEKFPENVIEVAIYRLSSFKFYEEGLELVGMIVKERGWDYFINQSLELNVGSRSLLLVNILDCMSKLGNPKSLPIAKIEGLLGRTNNDIEWMNVKALIDLRKKIENLEELDYEYLMSIAYNCGVDFFDQEKVRRAAEDIINENHEEYYGLLEELYQGVRDMWTDYPGQPDNKIITDSMDNYESMSIDELVDSLEAVYSFNILTRYEKREDVEKNFLLKEDELRARLKDFVSKNTRIFQEATFLQELKEKKDNLAMDHFDEYNIIPALGDFAGNEGKKTNDEKFGYTNNSTVISIAKNTQMLHSPTGKMLAIFAGSAKVEKKFSNSKEIMQIASFISHDNRLGERQYNSRDTSLAACLCFWDKVPQKIRDKIEKSFKRCGIEDRELENLIAYGGGQSFESIVEAASEYSHIIDQSVVYDMVDFVSDSLKERVNEPPPHFIAPSEFLDLINKEHGQTKADVDTIVSDIGSLNFSTIKFLERNLNLDLSLLSRKEFFSLILYLKTENQGKGFENIKNFIDDASEQKDKINRIKAFLSMEYDPEMGERILDIGKELEKQPELAEKLFAEYASVVDGAEKKADEVVKIYEDIFHEKKADKNQIKKAILKKASELLWHVSEGLYGTEEKDKPEMISICIEHLKNEEKIKKIAVDNLKQIFLELNKKCEVLDASIFLGINFTEKEYEEMKEIKKQRKEKLIKERGIEAQDRHAKFQKEFGKSYGIYEKSRIEGLLKY